MTVVKIILVFTFLFGLLFWSGIKHLIGKETTVKGGKPTTFSRLFGAFLVVLCLYVTGRGATDIILHDYIKEKITVKDIDYQHPRGMIMADIKSERGKTYRNLFEEFDFEISETYQIKYMKRTKFIIDVKGD